MFTSSSRKLFCLDYIVCASSINTNYTLCISNLSCCLCSKFYTNRDVADLFSNLTVSWENFEDWGKAVYILSFPDPTFVGTYYGVLVIEMLQILMCHGSHLDVKFCLPMLVDDSFNMEYMDLNIWQGYFILLLGSYFWASTILN